MASEWRTMTIDEIKSPAETAISIGPFGSRMKSDLYVQSGVPVIRGNNISDTRALDGGFVYVTPETADGLRSSNVYADDLVFPHRGAIGRVGMVPRDDHHRYLLSTSLMKLSCDLETVDPKFVFYFFRSPAGRHELLKNASTVGTPGIGQPLASLKSVTLPVPPLSEQRAIANILGTLDDKIELNRRMNETLETIARAIFKSWFVDFDPVRAKAEGRDTGLPPHIANLFPDSFEDSELGAIPSGWAIKTLDQMTSFVLGGDWGKESPSEIFSAETRCIRGADIPELQSAGLGNMPVRFLKQSSLEKRFLQNGDLVIEISGGSPTQSTGRPVLMSQELLQRSELPLVCSNFCRLVRPNSQFYSRFLYLWLRWLYSADEFLQFENGTTGIKNFAFSLFSSTYRFVSPPFDVAAAFDELTGALFRRREAAASESDSLASMRDTLLPKLISGELRMEDVELIEGTVK